MGLLRATSFRVPATTPVVIALCVGLTVVFGACRSDRPRFTGEIKADGSSTVFPLTNALAEEFLKVNPDVKILVDVSGTGGGFLKFCQGATDIQNASRPIDATEQAACEQNGVGFMEIPVAFDAVTVIIHPSNDWATSMSLAELRKLWEPRAKGTVLRWADVRSGWPDEPIQLYGPGPASGTFDFFTEAVTGTSRASRPDYIASEDDAVIVKGVAANRYALGYVGYAHFNRAGQSLRAVAIDSQRGTVALGAVSPSPDTVRRGVYRPLSRTLFVYVSATSAERAEVSSFVDFYLKQDEVLIESVGGIAMSPRTYELVRQRVKRRAAGTLFADRGVLNRNLELVLSEAQ
jgi:phosphate transport system substrate-binding protein